MNCANSTAYVQEVCDTHPKWLWHHMLYGAPSANPARQLPHLLHSMRGQDPRGRSVPVPRDVVRTFPALHPLPKAWRSFHWPAHARGPGAKPERPMDSRRVFGRGTAHRFRDSTARESGIRRGWHPAESSLADVRFSVFRMNPWTVDADEFSRELRRRQFPKNKSQSCCPALFDGAILRSSRRVVCLRGLGLHS